MLEIKRIYEDKKDEDGYRILVDRLWPRGVSKEKAEIDYWAKEIAPLDKSRKAFNHEADKFKDFKEQYLKELNVNNGSKDFLDSIKDKLKSGNVTLLYGAKNQEMNNAVVLKEWIEENI